MTTRPRDTVATPATEYADSLGAYLRDPTEANLAAAYEWGRESLEIGRSIPDVIDVHSRAFALARGNAGGARAAAPEEAASRFLAESLAPYEMARRGVRDAVLALRHLNQALEHETNRIAHAVHDEAGQLAVVLQLSLAELTRAMPPEVAANLEPLRATLDQVEQQLRQLSHELRPSMLDDLGWRAAIDWLAQSLTARGQLAVDVHGSFYRRLPGPVEIALYRVVQEALTNAARHARARHVTITISESARTLTVAVADDGIGFDTAAPRRPGSDSGLGLLGIRERLAAAGGSLHIDSRPGRGTCLLITVPLEIDYGPAAASGR